MPTISNSSLGGSTIKGISPKQTITNYKSNEEVRLRRIVTKSWNGSYAAGSVNGYGRKIGGFRAVNNAGDYLSRDTYNCGGIVQSQVFQRGLRSRFGFMFQNCDGSNIPPSTCNVKYVPDSSEYIKYRKQRAANVLYNDSTNGGDQSNASYTSFLSVHRY
jgi:hypothetical protein